MIDTTSIVPSTRFTVRRTSVPLGPLISFTASSKRIPTTSTGSPAPCATFRIWSPTSRSLPFHTGPPKITLVIAIPSVFFCNCAPIPSNLPDISRSKPSLMSGAI